MTIFGKLITTAFFLLVLAGGYFWYTFDDRKAEAITFTINGQPIILEDGKYEQTVPNSAAKVVTTYFGNEARGDFNNDGTEDRAYLVTQLSGGSGAFYYLVSSLGGEAAFVGDRVAPQTTEYRNGEIVVNYAERKPGEPMTEAPSVGVSKYFKIENNALVEIKKAPEPVPVETQSDQKGFINGSVTMSPTCPVETTPPQPDCAPREYVTEISAISKLSAEVVAKTTSAGGIYVLELPAGEYTIKTKGGQTYPRCENVDVSIKAEATVKLDISCDSGIR